MHNRNRRGNRYTGTEEATDTQEQKKQQIHKNRRGNRYTGTEEAIDTQEQNKATDTQEQNKARDTQQEGNMFLNCIVGSLHVIRLFS
ncbi:hypothetical protein BgiBS90_009524 [Biomphalaria glabrata]|nr:hypothetical protein BgiBS90_009524 [Biomphalaria glabrata]